MILKSRKTEEKVGKMPKKCRKNAEKMPKNVGNGPIHEKSENQLFMKFYEDLPTGKNPCAQKKLLILFLN
jgi:hypothetical protein